MAKRFFPFGQGKRRTFTREKKKPELVPEIPMFCGKPLNLSDMARIFDLHEVLLAEGRVSQEEYEILRSALRDKITAVLEGERRGG